MAEHGRAPHPAKLPPSCQGSFAIAKSETALAASQDGRNRLSPTITASDLAYDRSRSAIAACRPGKLRRSWAPRLEWPSGLASAASPLARSACPVSSLVGLWLLR